MNKLKSGALWLAFFSLALLILKDWIGLVIDVELWDRTVEAFLTFLIAAGIVSDNSKGTWYKDVEED